MAYLNHEVEEVSFIELNTEPHLSHRHLFIKQIYIELNDEKSGYDYPDEDFCLFKYFPHSKLVFPIVKSNIELNCTCTIAWLIQYWRFSFKDIKTSCLSNCFSSNFSLLVEQCNFDYRISQCFENVSAYSLPYGNLISEYLRNSMMQKENNEITSAGNAASPNLLKFFYILYFYIFLVDI
jgi:hypothetical protein